MSNFKNYNMKDIKQYYDNRVKQYGVSHKAAGWYSKYTQYIRFAALSLVGNLEGSVVMDVGCGQGDFKEYCNEQNLEIVYTGCDISENMLEIAKAQHPDSQFICSEFHKLSLQNSVDYVVASGLLSLKSVAPYEEYQDAIRCFLSWSRNGVAINLLSAMCPDEKKDIATFNYYVPSKILSLTQEITPYVELNHRYLENDMTLLIFKK